MNLDIIAQLVQILKDAPEVGAIEVRRGLLGRWSTIRVTKVGHASNAGGGGGGGGGGQHMVVAQAAAAAPASGSVAPPSTTHLVEIKSPMVGTFYSAPEPGAALYVMVGSRGTAGQVVCIIEAMKIMNEIESEVTGLVREVLLENEIGRA